MELFIVQVIDVIKINTGRLLKEYKRNEQQVSWKSGAGH